MTLNFVLVISTEMRKKKVLDVESFPLSFLLLLKVLAR